MKLQDTVEMMNSSDYKERFKAEYYQLLIRCQKLNNLINMIQSKEETDFTATVSLDLLSAQLHAMTSYMFILQERAKLEGVEFSMTDF